ncbi:hypothetical protein DY023_02205 [Microbacterium bovistercoris]|uniref:Uncharacterized protein n=1 Tax=Microbacterium bovistercoris TaxID=2293570 RepID=A0A371NY62_9MICO|nr:hypothetical protein [Microbacterium bovistercoris]REJ07802.1 hypothetical protein DY023_02205 [Microbacterium bovistercoris]
MSHRRALRSFIAVVTLTLAALVAPAVANADDDPPTVLPEPTAMTAVASSVPDLVDGLGTLPAGAAPPVLTSVDTSFLVTVSLTDAGMPASFPASTPVTFAANGGGTVMVHGDAAIPAGQATTTFELTYSEPTTALTVTVAAGGLTASTGSFPVELTLAVLAHDDASLLNGTAGSDGAACATVDAQHPMCALISLPAGAGGDVAVSLGVCADAACGENALVTQVLADLDDLYTRDAPAKMTIVCDKSLCGSGGVAHYRALWSTTAIGELVTTPACPAKGVIGDGQDFCTDQRASTRDRAGDLRLVVLFLTDVRGTI